MVVVRHLKPLPIKFFPIFHAHFFSNDIKYPECKNANEMLITLSYAETENNLQIISTIRLWPNKMDKFFGKLKKTDWQIVSTSLSLLSV
jgi:hypothetical protein